MAVRPGDIIARIGGSWTGPSYLAGRPLTYDGRGYDDIMAEMDTAIVRSALSSRSSAQITLLNEILLGKAFGQHHRESRLEGRDLDIDTLLTWATARSLFRGVIRGVDVDGDRVTIEAVDHSFRRSKKLGALVDSDTWPAARESDVGQPIPIPIGSPVDVFVPVVEEPLFATLDQDIAQDDDDLTTIAVGELPTAWLSSGTVIIDDEELSYTGVDETGNSPLLTGVTRAVNSTSAQEHRRGVIAYIADEFKVAFDSSGRSSTLAALRAAGREDRRYALTRSYTVSTENGSRIATFTRPPFFLEPSGPKFVYALSLEDFSSTASEPENAFTGEASFTEAGFATVEASSSGKDLIGKRLTSIPSLGQLEAAIVRVTHSGNRSDSDSPDFSAIGNAAVWANGVEIGGLSSEDSTIPGLVALQGGSRRQPVELPLDPELPGQAQRAIRLDTVTPSFDVPGFNEQPTWAGTDWLKTIDGNHNSNPGVMLHQPPVGNQGRTKYSLSTAGIPSDIDPASSLDLVRFVVRHGGSGESSSNPGTIALRTFYPVSTEVASFTDNPRNAPTNSFISYTPSGQTVADLDDYEFFFDVQTGAFETSAYFVIFEVFIEIKYTPPASAPISQAAGNVENHFLLPASTYSALTSLNNIVVQVQGDETNSFRVYSVDVALIVTPLEPRIVDRFLADIVGDISGTPAEIIDELHRVEGGNATTTISASDVATAAAALTSAGFTASAFRGVIRHEELRDVIQAIARESRLRVYDDLGVLRISYIPDLASVATGTLKLTLHDALGDASIEERGGVSEQEVLNKLTVLYDRTDLDGHRATELEEDAASQTAYGVREEELETRFLSGPIPAAALAASLVERRSRPFSRLSMRVLPTDTLITVELLTVLQVTLVDLASTKWEIDGIRENGDGTRIFSGALLD